MPGADSWDADLRSRSAPCRPFANFHEQDAKIEEKISGESNGSLKCAGLARKLSSFVEGRTNWHFAFRESTGLVFLSFLSSKKS